MSRILNVGSALLLVPAIIFTPFGLLYILNPEAILFPFIEDPGGVGVSVSQIRDLDPKLVDVLRSLQQLLGIFVLTMGLFWLVISFGPYRKGEKWAWYAMLVIGGIFVSVWSTLGYIAITQGLYSSVFVSLIIALGTTYAIFWGVGLALPAKEILSKVPQVEGVK